MLVKISEDENHNKIVKPIAGATLGQGVPLGTWCSFEKDVAPSNNWLMAGTTFDASVYPALNLYLGTNVVPSRYDHSRLGDYQNFAISSDSQNPSVMPYDGFMTLMHNGGTVPVFINGVRIVNLGDGSNIITSNTIPFKKGDLIYSTGTFSQTNFNECRVRYYTHPLFIKATSIANDTDQQAILAQIQAYNTYSTEETLTGKTWIDGKPIYRVVRHTVINSQLAQGYTTSNSIMTGPFTTNAETVVDIYALSYTTAGGWSKLYSTGGGGARAIAWRTDSTIYNNASDTIPNEQYIVLEYTKTTD